MDAHSIDPEHLGEESHEDSLERVARLRNRVFTLGGATVEGEKRAPVNLAGGREREPVDRDEGRGTACAGKRLRAKARRSSASGAGSRAATTYATRRGFVPSEWRTAVSETDGCEAENRLDLAELDAVAGSSPGCRCDRGKRGSRRAGSRPGRRSPQALMRRAAEQACDEPLSSQGGRVQVPPGEPGASYVHLPGDADRHGPTERVEDVYLSVGDRASHRHDVAEVLLRIEAGRVGRHLRGAVEVDQPALRNALAEAAKELDGGSSPLDVQWWSSRRRSSRATSVSRSARRSEARERSASRGGARARR